MEFSWWLLLLAGFAGWCIGYEKLRHSLANLPRLFARGSRSDLSTLLPDHDDQVERDLELNNLLEQYAVDNNSVDLYLTLGDAFRRRGEYSRAIGLHEHLLSTGSLSEEQQREVKLELSAASQASLLRLYEKQQEWEAAFDLASVNTTMDSAERGAVKAQYCCELAAIAELEDNLPEMENWLQRALKSEPNCSRALVMLGRYCIELKKYAEAITHFEAIEKVLRDHLEYVRGRQNSYSVVKLACAAIFKLEGRKPASEFFIDQLARRPSLKGLRDWAENELKTIKSQDKDKVEAIVEMLRDVTDEKPVYLCDRCGYRCKQIQWMCPGCENWNSVKVIIGAEGE